LGSPAGGEASEAYLKRWGRTETWGFEELIYSPGYFLRVTHSGHDLSRRRTGTISEDDHVRPYRAGIGQYSSRGKQALNLHAALDSHPGFGCSLGEALVEEPAVQVNGAEAK
jgi:hypothetical protein